MFGRERLGGRDIKVLCIAFVPHMLILTVCLATLLAVVSLQVPDIDGPDPSLSWKELSSEIKNMSPQQQQEYIATTKAHFTRNSYGVQARVASEEVTSSHEDPLATGNAFAAVSAASGGQVPTTVYLLMPLLLQMM